MALRATQGNEKPALPGHANDTATEPRPAGSGFSGERQFTGFYFLFDLSLA
jgi:hypothetical protein